MKRSGFLKAVALVAALPTVGFSMEKAKRKVCGEDGHDFSTVLKKKIYPVDLNHPDFKTRPQLLAHYEKQASLMTVGFKCVQCGFVELSRGVLDDDRNMNA